MYFKIFGKISHDKQNLNFDIQALIVLNKFKLADCDNQSKEKYFIQHKI